MLDQDLAYVEGESAKCLLDMACSLAFLPHASFPLLAGREHGRIHPISGYRWPSASFTASTTALHCTKVQ